MKKLIYIVIAVLLITVYGSQVEAQKAYKFGYKTAPTSITSALTVSVTPNQTFTQYTLAADTNITVNVVSTYALPGDLVAFKIKANTRNRTITFGTNIEASAPTITATKTVTYLFLYNGTNFYLCGSGAAD